MGIKVSFKFGNHSGVRTDNFEDGFAQFTDALGEEVTRRAADSVNVDVRQLQDRLSRQVDRSLRAAVTFAAKNLVGTLSANRVDGGGTIPSTKIYFDWDEPLNPIVNPTAAFLGKAASGEAGALQGAQGRVDWRALSAKTLKKKAGSPLSNSATGFAKETRNRQTSARQHFIHTGALQRDLLRLAANVTQKTGTVELQYKKRDETKNFSRLRNHNRRLTVGQLRMTFVPKMRLRQIPGIQSGNVADYDPNVMFESSLGITGTSLDKLRGESWYHRPLLQPVFTYWVLNRIPRLVARTIAGSIKER